MSEIHADLSGVSESLQLGDFSKLVNVSDGVIKVVSSADVLGEMQVGTGTGVTSAVTLAQLNAEVATIMGAASGDVIATINAISDAIGDDADFATTLATIQTATDNKFAAIATLVGVAELATHFATFTGATLTDNITLKDLLQLLEVAVELRATSANPVFSGPVNALGGTLYINDDSSEAAKVGLTYNTATSWATVDKRVSVTGDVKTSGSLLSNVIEGIDSHLKFKSTTNDVMFYHAGVETWQVTDSSTALTTRFTSHGDPTNGVHEFKGVLKGDKIEVGTTVDGRNVSDDGAHVDMSKTRYAAIDSTHATGVATNFGDSLADCSYIQRVVVVPSVAWDDSTVILVGKTGSAAAYGTITAAQTAGTDAIFFNVPKHISGATQLTFTVTGATSSVTAGAAEIFVEVSS